MVAHIVGCLADHLGSSQTNDNGRCSVGMRIGCGDLVVSGWVGAARFSITGASCCSLLAWSCCSLMCRAFALTTGQRQRPWSMPASGCPLSLHLSVLMCPIARRCDYTQTGSRGCGKIWFDLHLAVSEAPCAKQHGLSLVCDVCVLCGG